MIIPGEITLELMINSETYLYVCLIVPVFFAALSGFTANLIHSEKKERTITSYSRAILAGMLSYLAVKGLAGAQIETVSGLDGLISMAILVGYSGRAILPLLSKRLKNKITAAEVKPEHLTATR